MHFPEASLHNTGQHLFPELFYLLLSLLCSLLQSARRCEYRMCKECFLLLLVSDLVIPKEKAWTRECRALIKRSSLPASVSTSGGQPGLLTFRESSSKSNRVLCELWFLSICSNNKVGVLASNSAFFLLAKINTEMFIRTNTVRSQSLLDLIPVSHEPK